MHEPRQLQWHNPRKAWTYKPTLLNKLILAYVVTLQRARPGALACVVTKANYDQHILEAIVTRTDPGANKSLSLPSACNSRPL